MKEYLKRILIYCGLSKDSYYNIQDRVHVENNLSVSFFSLISAAPFVIIAIYSAIVNMNVPPLMYIITGAAFISIYVINRLVSKKHPKISDFFAELFVVILLAAGVYLGVTQTNHRTTLLLPFFVLASLLFSFRIIYLVIIMATTEIVYLILCCQYQTGEILKVNTINTLIFSIVGLIIGSYLMIMKYREYETDYLNTYLLEHDTLTSLFNRQKFKNDLEKLSAENIPFTVFEFDIDDLKKCNDSKGHDAGDELIVASAKCLENVFGRFGNVYRFGGDEFEAILTEGEYNPDQLLRELDNTTKNWKGKLVNEFSISGGYSVKNPETEKTIGEFLRDADINMYENKRKHKEQSQEK